MHSAHAGSQGAYSHQTYELSHQVYALERVTVFFLYALVKVKDRRFERECSSERVFYFGERLPCSVIKYTHCVIDRK